MTSDPHPRRLFLDSPPGSGAPILAEGELHHALHVLRVEVGDDVIGLDGRGAAWPLRVVAAGRRALELAVAGEPRRAPAPGEEGAAGPWVELCVSLPKAGRAEEMLDRLTQLGCASLRPLVGERTPPHARELAASRRARLVRVAREACKQANRLWLPELATPLELGDLGALEPAGTAVLDPLGARPLAAWIAERRGGRRWRAIVGPEGGWTETELAALGRLGLERVRLAPHVLRIETAAELACGLLVHLAGG